MSKKNGKPMKTWTKVAIGALVAAILAVTAGPFVYINFIKEDAPDKLSLADAPVESTADAPVESTSTSASTSASASASASTAATTAAQPADTTETTPAAGSGADGTYTITADSVAGYRVVEVLFGQDTEGVGRTNSVTGSITVTGTQVTAAEFSVDMTTLVSDEDNRDRKFKGEIMDTGDFPTATFVITEPIELGSVPADNTEISATATGDLTLHGVTKSVTLEVTAKKSGTSIAIAGSTDVVFSDYDIDNPSTGGITTEDHGLIEFLLVAVTA